MLPVTTGSVETTLLLFVPSGIVAMRIEGTVTSSLNSPIYVEEFRNLLLRTDCVSGIGLAVCSKEPNRAR